MGFEDIPINDGESGDIKMPTLQQTIIQEFAQPSGRFKEIDLDGEGIFVEKSKPDKSNKFVPSSRFFVFPNGVLEVDTPEIKDLFHNNNLDFLRMLKNTVPEEEEIIYSSPVIKAHNGIKYRIKHYRSSNGDDRKQVIAELRERNSKKL